MQHLKCRQCHHEWDGYSTDTCLWCGCDKPIVLEEETVLTKYTKVLVRTLRKQGETTTNWLKRIGDNYWKMYPQDKPTKNENPSGKDKKQSQG